MHTDSSTCLFVSRSSKREPTRWSERSRAGGLVSLRTNRDKAFTHSEIATGIEGESNTAGTALTRLKQRDFVRHRGQYWAIPEDLSRARAAYDRHTVTKQFDDEAGGECVRQYARPEFSQLFASCSHQVVRPPLPSQRSPTLKTLSATESDSHSVSCRTVSTGASLVRKTLSVTLPSRCRRNPERPCVPIVTRSVPCALTKLLITSWGVPGWT